MEIDAEALAEVIDRALGEDLGAGDITTDSIVPEKCTGRALWTARDRGVVCGLEVAAEVFRRLDGRCRHRLLVDEGQPVEPGDRLAEFSGSCRALLSGERVALNLAQRMSGIASETARLAARLHGYPTRLLDTRKTMPGLRLLDRYAVAVGGGVNHRQGLFDQVLIKDNHIAVAGGRISEAVRRVREVRPETFIEVEVTTLEQVDEALAAGVSRIMLDNMPVDMMKHAVSRIGRQAETEASGNMRGERFEQAAQCGVDYISVGAITHSATALDISQSLEIVEH